MKKEKELSSRTYLDIPVVDTLFEHRPFAGCDVLQIYVSSRTSDRPLHRILRPFGNIGEICRTDRCHALIYHIPTELHEFSDCMIIVATDAPLEARNLERLAKRAMLGLGKTGGVSSNGSGDYVIAFSVANELRIPYLSESPLITTELLSNDKVSPLFMAVIEATEEAILNSLFMAVTTTGYRGRTVKELPVNQVLEILKQYNTIK